MRLFWAGKTVMIAKPWWGGLRTVLIAGLVSQLLGNVCRAQQPAQPSQQQQSPAPAAAQPPGPSQPQQDPKTDANASAGAASPAPTSKDRLFWTLPNFLTIENAGKIPPLTAGQKFKVVARSSFDPVQYPYYAFLAGIGQAEQSEESYGQGAAGYGKRFGSAFADGTIENFMTGAIFPSLLREDPRFFQLGKGSFFHRTSYAVSRVLVTRTDAGHNQINLSELLGAGAAAGISNAYHPAGDRTVRNTMTVWGTQMAWDAVAFTVKEFWPDIRRKIHKQGQQTAN